MDNLPNPPQDDSSPSQNKSHQPPSETAPPTPLDDQAVSLPNPPSQSDSQPASHSEPSSSPPPPPPPDQPPSNQPPQEDSPEPQPAKPPVKTSPFKWLAPVLIGVVIVSAIGFAVYKFVLQDKTADNSQEDISQSAPATTLSYYGLWETSQTMQPVFDQFQKNNPNIKVNYQSQSSADYRQRLQTALSSDNPPDIVRIHSTWIPSLASQLQPAPQSLLSSSDINSSFYSVISSQVLYNKQVYAIPLNFDSLVLYVNHDLIGENSVPTNWLDLQKLARQTTKKDPNTGQITQAGLSLGNTTNVDHWPDIISLMLLQNGVNLSKPEAEPTLETLKFYLLFNNSQQPTWSTALPNSTQAFISGKLAFYLAPTWRIPQIKQANPAFNWKTHPVPQLPQASVVNWSNFWVEAVPKSSKNAQLSWQLLKFLASANAQQTLFQSSNQARGYAQPPANKNLQNEIAANPSVAPVVQQASSTQTFYTTGSTHDGSTGINSRLIKYLEDALNALSKNPNDDEAISTLQNGFDQVLSQYQLNTTQ